jgi:hypothetical protein
MSRDTEHARAALKGDQMRKKSAAGRPISPAMPLDEPVMPLDEDEQLCYEDEAAAHERDTLGQYLCEIGRYARLTAE